MLYSSPPRDLAEQFTRYIDAVCRMVAAFITIDRTAGLFIAAVYRPMRRRLGRFVQLFTQYQAGTLPAPHPARPRSDARAPSDRPRPRPAVSLPSRPAWLAYRVIGIGAFGGQLRTMLGDPQMAVFLAAAPQARRLISPIWRMLNTDPLPEVLRPPPKPVPVSVAPRNDPSPSSDMKSESPAFAPGERRPRRVRSITSPVSRAFSCVPGSLVPE